MNGTTNTQGKYLIVLGIIILVVIIGGVAWFLKQPKLNLREVNNQNTTFKPAVGVEVKTNDTTTAVGKKAPVGMPITLPITGDIVESYSATYTDKNTTQYTLSMNSDTTKTQIVKDVLEYLQKNNFVLDAKNTNQNLGQIYASKSKDSVSVIVSTINGKSFVQINYLKR